MTVRFVLVAIDDERPLGPQMRAALSVLSWKTVRALVGNAYSERWLRGIVESSDFSERQTVTSGSMFPPNDRAARDIIMGLFGSAPQPQATPAPTPPAPDDSDAEAAAEKERLADETSVGRSATILEQYGASTQTPPVRSATLGAA